MTEKCSDCVTALHCEAVGDCMQYMTPAEYRAKVADANEREALEQLSRALTNGSAGTWDEVFHAAEVIRDEVTRLEFEREQARLHARVAFHEEENGKRAIRQLEQRLEPK